MKNKIIVSAIPVLLLAHYSYAQQYRFSDGLYRLPYNNGVSVKVLTNVWNHSPRGCFDILGEGASLYNIVAAAGGWIRAIRDFNDEVCGGANCCNDNNNFIVLEHANGEWSTYIHLQQNSISALGHELGDWVEAGTALGIEGDIGCATGSHLHLEVSRPFDPTNAWDNYDGVLRRHGELLNPVFCSVSTGYLFSGFTYAAGSCNYNCPASINASGAVTNTVLRADNSISSTQVFNTAGTGMYRASSAITLSAGFTAQQGVMFTAQIKTCNQY